MKLDRYLFGSSLVLLAACALGCGASSTENGEPQTTSGSTTTPGQTDGATTPDQTGDESDGGGETGLPDEAYESPNCEALQLPGDPSDVAQTPRPDHDAELVALTLLPNALVARQAHYDIVADDFALMREQVPELADVHPECIAPTGYHVWAGQVLTAAIWLEEYRGWDCHNAYYGITGIRPTDSLAFYFETPGIYGPQLADIYEALPGFADTNLQPAFPDTEPYNDCEPTSGSITLDAALGENNELIARTYTWEHPRLGTFVFAATATTPPTLAK